MELIQNRHDFEAGMSVSLSIKDVPEEMLQRLRARAARNHRSLQKELLAVIEAAAFEETELTVEELVEHVCTSGLSTPDESVGWLRELRDGR